MIEVKPKVVAPHVCDDCLMIAYDHGIVSYVDQASMMMLIGAESADHLCEGQPCLCGCPKGYEN